MKRDLLKMKAAALLLLSICTFPTAKAITFASYNSTYNLSLSVDNETYTATVIAMLGAQTEQGNVYKGDVTIPATLSTYIPFMGTMDVTVTGIAAGAFKDCDITSVSIPETVTSIGDSAFYNTSLAEVKLPDAFTGTVGQYVFAHCQKLTKFDTGDGVTFSSPRTAGTGLCDADSLLADVRIGSGVKTLPTYSFRNCVSLKSFHIPANVTKLNGALFLGTTGGTVWTLDSLVVEDSETGITSSSAWNSNVLARVNVINIYLGRNVTNFRTPDVSHWKTFTIGPKVTSISKYLSTSRTESYIGLEKVQTLNTDPSACPGTFSDVIYEKATLVVPDGTLDAYKADANWGKFHEIVEASTTTAIAAPSASGAVNADAPAYNLAGQRVGKDYKGVVIVGGRKLIRR